MKFGILFANVGTYVQPDMAASLGRIAEEHGFESIWTVEHVVVPAGYESQYPYSPTGRMPGPEESPIPDPLIWLTWVGAATTTLRLATGILILPQRNPVILAKELATLDVLSSGRVELGVGVGWLREEFDVGHSLRRARRSHRRVRRGAANPVARRGAVLRRKIRADVRCFPHPVQKLIPIHIGGHTLPAARRAGRLGDGFFPGRSTDDELVPLLDTMRAAAEDAGRDSDAIEVTAGGVMDPRLLQYYNLELQHLRETGAEFAQQFPKIAARLGMHGLEVADPYVERLLEGVAFLAARVQLKIDAEFPRFTQALLEIVYPHYLAPTPSMLVAQIKPDANDPNLAGGPTVPRGSTLSSVLAARAMQSAPSRTAVGVEPVARVDEVLVGELENGRAVRAQVHVDRAVARVHPQDLLEPSTLSLSQRSSLDPDPDRRSPSRTSSGWVSSMAMILGSSSRRSRRPFTHTIASSSSTWP
jgi:probable F420-dependent oxidoreductase